ncbi:MAG: ArsR/SmtB family transcription factor [Hyphomicrobiaceae bacterium]
MKSEAIHLLAPEGNTAVGLVEAAQGFSAIGSEPRLEVLLALVRAGPEGLNVGDIQKRLDMPASTLTHHLRFLAAAGLIEQIKDGRSIRNLAAFDRIGELAAYLLRECCADRAGSPGEGKPHDHAR